MRRRGSSRVYVGVNVPGRRGTLEVIDTARRQVVATATGRVGERPMTADTYCSAAVRRMTLSR
jgi:hypothetical protein